MTSLKAIIPFMCLLSMVHCQIKGKPIKFKLTAVNLPSKDLGGFNDPYVEVYQKDGKQEFYEKFGQTATEIRTNEPVWGTVFHFNYVKGANQTLRFLVKDWDLGWNVDDDIGAVDVSAQDLVKQIEQNTAGLRAEKPIQLFLERPKGGVLILHPIVSESFEDAL